MKSIASLVLFSALSLAASCSKESQAAGPGTGPAAPAAGAPKAETPAVPKTDAAKPAAQQPAATAAVADLPKILAGIKDAETAKSSKGALDTIVTQLEAAKAAAPAPAAGGAVDLGKIAGDTATKLGVSPETVEQVKKLLADPAIKAVIGPTLEKLQGLLK
jgi:hypothetical protein